MPKLKVDHYFDVQCDICARTLSEDYGRGFFSTADSARIVAKHEGFRVLNGRNYCSFCYMNYLESKKNEKAFPERSS